MQQSKSGVEQRFCHRCDLDLDGFSQIFLKMTSAKYMFDDDDCCTRGVCVCVCLCQGQTLLMTHNS